VACNDPPTGILNGLSPFANLAEEKYDFSMEQIVDLDPSDDITSIKHRIELALSGPEAIRRLLFIVPATNQALQSLIAMKLLARIARTRAVEVALVSDHPTIRTFAQEAKVKIFGNRHSAQRAGWITPDAPTIKPSPRPVRKKSKKYKVVKGKGRIGLLEQIGALLLLVALALGVVIGAITLLPQATVTLTPVARPLEADLVVIADPAAKSINFKTHTFPAKEIRVELALPGEVETVETEYAPIGYARGHVTFINRTDQFQLIPVSTTLTTSAGQAVQFMTQVSATIPPGNGATSAPVLVEALEEGDVGNVRAGQITRFADPTYGAVARVINERGFSGGTWREARVVVQEDKERLRAHLLQKIQQEGLLRLQELLGPQEFIAPNSVEVIPLELTFQEFAGDFSDTLSGEMQAVVQGTAIGGYGANRLALAALEAQLPPGYELDPTGLNFGAGEVLKTENSVVTFKIHARGIAKPVIDPHRAAAAVAWLSVGEAQNLLSDEYDLATVPGVEVQPDWARQWLGRLPYSSFQIKVVVKEAVIFVTDGE
jgi:hypothetical protein